MGFTCCSNRKQNEKHDFLKLLNIPSYYRLKDNKQGVWHKDVLGGFFQKLISREGSLAIETVPPKEFPCIQAL